EGGPVKIPDGIEDEKVLFLSDILPTGWQGAVQCDIQPTDTVAIWGCGPVGQMTIRSAILLGAKQVIAIDRLPERLSMARAGGAITINFEEESVIERLNELTVRTGQTHVNRWTDDLLNLVIDNQIDPSFVITHTEPLERGPEMYKTFRDKQDGCVKVVLRPGINGASYA